MLQDSELHTGCKENKVTVRKDGSPTGLSGPIGQPLSVLLLFVSAEAGVDRGALAVKAPSSLGSTQRAAWALLLLPSFLSASLSRLLGRCQSRLHNSTEKKKQVSGQQGTAAGWRAQPMLLSDEIWVSP